MAVYTKEFKSISDFYQYISTTPYNYAFRNPYDRDSIGKDYGWYQTSDYNEAIGHMLNGTWTTGIENLNKQFKATMSKQPQPTMRRSFRNSVAGFAPVVPLYLAGVPTNMLQQIQIPQKSKVLDVVKSINYNCQVPANTIMEESVKALVLVNQLEKQGYRVNLSIAFASYAGNTICSCIRLKNANEKLNIAKLAFPMVHPSMLRRCIFRFIEVFPKTTVPFKDGYGIPETDREMQAMFPGKIVLPPIWNVDVHNIDMDTLVSRR